MQNQIDRKLEVEHFLQGSDPEEHIVKMECGYDDDHVTVFYRDANGEKKIRKDEFRPFCWCTERAALELYRRKEKPGEVNRDGIKEKLAEYGMACKGLRTANDDGFVPERMKNGHKILFYAIRPMSYSKFMEFFKKGGVPIYPREKDANYGRRDFQTASPIEQYMISTGKRMFKGYEDYDELVRLEWDLETEGLDPHIHAISQIGIRTNKGFEKIITVDGDTRDEKLDNEIKALEEMFSIVRDLDPDVMTGHNTENFDWVFVDERLKLRGSGLFEFSKNYFQNGIFKKKKKAVLKLGGEVEYYNPTVFYGVNITDSLHAVRRAQALDSTMKKADLKYVTKFSKLNKANRVYVPGKLINKTWEVLDDRYAFNNENGDWYLITDKKPIKEGYERVSGRYVVQRYLLDDLYEGDKVELQYNQSNFRVGKLLPLSFERACTMGTAGIWKYIMMAWSYEHNLAIPESEPSRQFTGGLSRLIKVGFVDNVAKLDYNSLYPSIILSFGIKVAVDITDAMPSMLEYILTQREFYKGLKKKYGKEADKYEKEKETLIKSLRELPEYARLSDGDFGKTVAKLDGVRDLAAKTKEAKQLKVKYDKLQLPFKILGNSWFGSASSGVFPWDDINVGEETTCTGRMMFRLLIRYFEGIGYQAIVGDSVTGDTPLFVRYPDGNIDIKPISELFSDEYGVDEYGREYDMSEKDYEVLCRSGWIKPNYIYRHRTDKDLYEINEGHTKVTCTEDHSLFDENGVKIKPSEIDGNTRLEYYKGKVVCGNAKCDITYGECDKCVKSITSGETHSIPFKFLNMDAKMTEYFYNSFIKQSDNLGKTHLDFNKQIISSLLFMKKKTQL